MKWLGNWLGRLPTSVVVRLAIVLNALIMLLVVALVAVGVLGQRRYHLEVAQQEAYAVVTEQARQISDQAQNIEYVLGQLETRLNVERTLEDGARAGMHDLLRQFQQLIPRSVDLLLLQRDGQVLAASTIVSAPQSLSRYCPLLQEDRPEVERRGLYAFQGSYSGRCPPEGTLIRARALQTGAEGRGESVWLLLEGEALQGVFDQLLPGLGVGWRYRIHGREADQLLATGGRGLPDRRDPAGTTAADAPELIEISEVVAGTSVRLELAIDATSVLRQRWQPQALRQVTLGAVFLLFWGGLSFFIVRMVLRRDRALLASEQRFDRSLDYAGVGAWEWDIVNDVVHWTKRCWPMFGYAQPLEVLRRADFVSRLHPQDQPRVEQALQDCLERNAAYKVDFRVVWPDGSLRSVHAAGNVRRDAQGRPLSMYGVMQDLTHQTELAGKLQSILDNVIDAIITIDKGGVITSFNHAASHIFGYEMNEVLGHKVNMLMPDSYSREHDGYIERHQRTGEKRIIGIGREVQGRHKSGRIFPIHLAVSLVEHEGHPTYVGVIRDITESKRAEEEIQRLAYSDQLTGLPNRRLLLDRLGRALALSQRNGQHGALIFIDIDHFKELNDAHGHEVGDLLLSQVALRLVPAMRECDTVARLGGDEFVVLVEELGADASLAAGHAEAVAQKLTQAFVRQSFELKGRAQAVSASLGITVFGPGSPAADVLMAQADMAMYQAKQQGRNDYRFFDEALQQRQLARAELEQEMRQSLQREDFFLVYQPQFDVEGRALGVEALVRWRHPVRGLVAPGEFIELAEQSGLIIELGHVVLRAASRQLALWSAEPLLAGLVLSVNVSASQFRHDGFERQVIEALDAAGVAPDRLKLELTESALADDVDTLARRMQMLRNLGVSFSLDDFGTGYSSLSYLKRLPIAQLKIDRSFVVDLPHDSNSAAIARTVVALGQSLGMMVIAEGVETADQVATLHACGCHAYQGYYYSRPLMADQLRDFLAGRATGTAAT